MLGNRPSTCSYYSCRRPNISVMHPFPDKRGGKKKKKRVRSGLKRAGVRYQTGRGRVCVFRKLTWMHGFISWFLSFREFLSIWICEDVDKSCASIEFIQPQHKSHSIKFVEEKALVNKRGHWIKTLQTPDDPTCAKYTRQDYCSNIKMSWKLQNSHILISMRNMPIIPNVN